MGGRWKASAFGAKPGGHEERFFLSYFFLLTLKNFKKGVYYNPYFTNDNPDSEG
jgi:hypothetical protein